MESVIHALGTEDFARLRIGVGRPRTSTISHVLGPFSREEAKQLPRLIDLASDATRAALLDGVEAAMNQYNRDWSSEIAG